MDDILFVVVCDTGNSPLLNRSGPVVKESSPLRKLDICEVFIDREVKPKVTKRQWRESLRRNG